jgi:hypothetical protein
MEDEFRLFFSASLSEVVRSPCSFTDELTSSTWFLARYLVLEQEKDIAAISSKMQQSFKYGLLYFLSCGFN